MAARILPRTSLASALTQEVGANGRVPVRAIGRDAAAGDRAVDMRVVVEPLGPGVEHGHDADGAADIARITGELDDRRGGGAHQQAVGVALMAAHHVAQFGRHGDGDMEVMGRQHFGAAGFEPLSVWSVWHLGQLRLRQPW